MIEWFNENENRPYPLDADTFIPDDNGNTLPFDVLADLSVSVPEGIDKVYLTGMYFGPAVVSLALGTGTQGLLVASIPKSSINEYQPIYLTSLGHNVSGYVVLGRGAAEHTGNYKFSQGQMKLAFRAVRYFHGAKVTSVNKYGLSADSAFGGIVNLEADGDLYIRRVDEHTIAVGLNPGTETDYLSLCDRVAEFNKCGAPPIRGINNAVPDQHGIIVLRVK